MVIFMGCGRSLTKVPHSQWSYDELTNPTGNHLQDEEIRYWTRCPEVMEVPVWRGIVLAFKCLGQTAVCLITGEACKRGLSALISALSAACFNST